MSFTPVKACLSAFCAIVLHELNQAILYSSPRT